MAENKGVITMTGRKKLCMAHAGDETLPKIAKMAWGDGGVDEAGTPKLATGNEVGLYNKLLEKVIENHSYTSDDKTTCRYTATLAAGELTGKEISEALLNNDIYLKMQMERLEHVTEVALTVGSWIGENAPYSQTVLVSGAAEGMEPTVVSALADGADAATAKAYIKAFGIICGGTAELTDGQAVFKVYKKPVTDITIGLKGV